MKSCLVRRSKERNQNEPIGDQGLGKLVNYVFILQRMEKLCKIRNIQHAISDFETHFIKQYGLSLNEGMVLCSLLEKENLSSGEISELLGLTSSNTSKVIRCVEEKGLVERIIGRRDKRHMYFSLTEQGKERISSLRQIDIQIPPLLEQLLTI